ncbi:hypothetical protein CSO01_05480 [Cellulomonas soli]|uniref:Tox-REase-7 domain-containing protein n=2 Tax=Cellulomonas soli TaxID=931535 RepID=A0A512P9F3_9CELL|nr:hypothetical protein CSO01_05480 [Cellulomonas soli]
MRPVSAVRSLAVRGPAAAEGAAGLAQLSTRSAPSTTALGVGATSAEELLAANAAVDGMVGVRAAGAAGEQAAGIIKNTQRIPSLSGTASYRIPDELTSTALGEVKNVANLSYTNQLRDFAAYAEQEGMGFNLYVRDSTTLSGPLQDAVSAGQINLIRSLP